MTDSKPGKEYIIACTQNVSNYFLRLPTLFLSTAGFESSPIIETFQTDTLGVERYGTIAAFRMSFTHPGQAKCIFRTSSHDLNAETIFSTTTGFIHSWYASAEFEYKIPIATKQLDSNVDYYIFCAQHNISKIAVLKVNFEARFRLNEHWNDGKIYREINVGATRASVATKFAKTGLLAVFWVHQITQQNCGNSMLTLVLPPLVQLTRGVQILL